MKDKNLYKKTGWEILNNKNQITISKILSKITITVERNEYLGQDRLRVSRKTLNDVFDILNNRTQRIRKPKKRDVEQKDGE